MQAYYATHPDVVPTYLLSGPLFSTATLAKTSIVDEAPAGATQSLAHMSATQKIRIVDMDQMSDDERNSEADAEEERKEAELEQSGDAMDEDGVTDEKEEVAKWGVVLAAQETLDGGLW
jgi:DNA polymerase delta subunit 3